GHHPAHRDEGACVVDRPWPDGFVGRGRAATARGHRGVGVVGDEAAWPADLVHDLVAGVDAEAAVDALQLRAVADVDAHRADDDAGVAVDAVAAAFPALALLVWAARFAAVPAEGDLARMLVEHGPL